MIPKAIVTGGAGFIGSHLAEALVKSGTETITVDNYSSGKRENLAHLKNCPNFKEIDCDVLDIDGLNAIFEGVDTVFHQAASKKSICDRDPRVDLRVNAEGAFNLLQISVKHKVRKFVHASTGSVYGEAQYYPTDERHSLCPSSYYGVSKMAGEKYVKLFGQLHGLDVTVLRYFHVYGPRQESSDVGGVVSIFIRSMLQGKPITIFGDGTQQRSFTYVGDIVKANLIAAEKSIASGEIYNCASGIRVTVGELAAMVADILQVTPEVLYGDWMPGEVKVFDIDNRKVSEHLHVKFVTNLREGLKEVVEWAVEYFKGN